MTCKIWYINGSIFNSFPNFFKFKKILEKSGDFAQNLAQNWPDQNMNGSLFLEKLVLYGSTFKFRGGMSLPKPNLSITPYTDQCTLSVTVWDNTHKSH